MAIAFRAQAEGHGTANNQTVNKPTGTVDGDLIIAVVETFAGGTHDLSSAPAGFTQIGTTVTWRTASPDSKARVYWKIASGEPATYTFNGNAGTSPNWQVYVSSYSGPVDAATPINQFDQTAVTTATNPISGTSITPSVNNCLIVTMCLARQGAALTTDITPPATYTLEWERADTTFSTRDEAADKLQTSAAATGALSWTLAANQSGKSIIYTLAIAPPANDDSSTESVALTPSAVESPGLGSLGTEALALSPSAVETIFAETGTLPLALVPSSAELRESIDTNTERLSIIPSGVEPQFGLVETGTELFKFSPSALEVKAKEYVDSATERLVMTITSHECYAIATPEYNVEVMKRWNMNDTSKIWEINSVTKRWNSYIVTAAFEIPC